MNALCIGGYITYVLPTKLPLDFILTSQNLSSFKHPPLKKKNQHARDMFPLSSTKTWIFFPHILLAQGQARQVFVFMCHSSKF